MKKRDISEYTCINFTDEAYEVLLYNTKVTVYFGYENERTNIKIRKVSYQDAREKYKFTKLYFYDSKQVMLNSKQLHVKAAIREAMGLPRYEPVQPVYVSYLKPENPSDTLFEEAYKKLAESDNMEDVISSAGSGIGFEDNLKALLKDSFELGYNSKN